MHRESKENLAATNVSRLNRTRSGVSGKPMLREESDLVQQAANLHRPVAEGAIRGMNDYGRAASGAERTFDGVAISAKRQNVTGGGIRELFVKGGKGETQGRKTRR